MYESRSIIKCLPTSVSENGLVALDLYPAKNLLHHYIKVSLAPCRILLYLQVLLGPI